ncbi:ABC transporter, ATP-binding protein domain containing protein [Theileria equi strain WA]|uniref:ABC transporter, ATP-binding protein domain containing protein n=1 Tax=Theileria equi strain WA TaxID=1537102 RepID=L0AZ97_THEEQ|nr:ABC transporter, ATP-binding protein domain containing protein [Theileria equi strain WA]AFZ80341.1 ABC transporter, ATP-binding protein domain containing protein [Theileria equi strain WA]|eukprot:XP_004830007.1 ABC transporter, ATP-binding protein domain containing protein [Theileria equi strain WA]
MMSNETIDPQASGHSLWEGESMLHQKRSTASDERKLRYFDEKNIFSVVFFIWMYKWVKATAERYLDPYMLHPLPIGDQILIWQPTFSRHVSDGIASLEALGESTNGKKSEKYILWRAIWLTFWKRILIILVAIICMNAIGMGAAISLHYLLDLFSGGEFELSTFGGLTVSIISIELFKEICMDHIDYHVRRLAIVIDSCLRVTIFQHGLCYRRSQFGNFQSKEGACKSIIHNCSGEDKCTDNPLLCPARRYKNNEVTPKIYSLILNDSYFIPLFVECLTGLIDFLTAFTYGLILISQQFHMKALTILIISLSLVVCMVIVELVNGLLMKGYLGIRDHRITKSFEVVSSLPLINKMFLDDVSHNTVTEARNDELRFIVIRFFLSILNKVIITSIICVDIIFLIKDFVQGMSTCPSVDKLDPSGLLASIFVLLKILGPLYLIPLKLRLLIFSLTSLKRVEAFLRTCSPNFYLPDNKFTGDIPLPEVNPGKDKTLPKGLVVMFKKASFAWINSRKDLLDNTGTTCLRNLDFVLNSGDLAIITGAQGSGKTNFVKAILGDMTLVEGSMAVLPLSTNMPIFYASQDVWLQKGTIRSNITFGHRFDEELYKTVIKAVELEHDISTWEGGDLRKISEHGYSLSGGQRVRVGLARAIYAYLIFSTTNREDNNSKCSFLVVLDDSFTGLDPFVAKTIFRNLFNAHDGLLKNNDVATVLTISRNMLDVCVSSESSESFPDAPIYFLENKGLVQSNKLKSLIEHEVGHIDISLLSNTRALLPFMSNEVRKLCSSDDYTRDGRRRSTESRYSDSPTVDDLYARINLKSDERKGFKPYRVYLRAAGWPILLFLLITIIFSTLDNTKFIITSKISDIIVDYKKTNGGNDDFAFSDLEDYCISAMKWIIILSASVMAGTLLRAILMTMASFNVSRKIHEYCVNSVFVNSSVVVKIKRSIGGIITFLSIDTFLIDNFLSCFIHDTSVLSIEMIVHLITLLFLVPWATPLAVLLGLIILRFIVYYYIKSCRNVFHARLETFNQINTTIETAISGSSVFRSFKKEWELANTMVEHVDYNLRCDYLTYSGMTWSSISSRCLFSPLAIFILVFPLVISRYYGTEVQVGYYAMAYSIFLSFSGAFANFIKIYCLLEFCLVPMRRFENFVPPDTRVKFQKKRNIHQTDFVVDRSEEFENIFNYDIKGKLRVRRSKEYLLRRKSPMGLKMLFHNHKVNIFDVSQYTTPGHNRIKLDNVSVYTHSRKDGTQFPILKNVTCSADASDIIGIIGRTGAGKSTLLSVLQNLAENRDGSVLLDGCDLNDMPKSMTRQIIGVLPQLPFVFRGWTVRRFVDPRMLFDDIDIEMALENCGLLKFVENLPGDRGLDTVILPDHYHKDMPKYCKRVYYGPSLRPHRSSSDSVNIDHGAVLSNSQLRMLSVARLVLYREFYKILLIDEPPEDEVGTFKTVDIPIYEILRAHFQHCATFIAAHDASVLRPCTSVWVLHKGSLIRTCKAEDTADSDSLSKIIEDCILHNTLHAV